MNVSVNTVLAHIYEHVCTYVQYAYVCIMSVCVYCNRRVIRLTNR